METHNVTSQLPTAPPPAPRLDLRLWRPSPQAIAAAQLAASDQPLSYGAVGETATLPLPTGWTLDQHQIDLGTGAETFARAAAAVRAWRMFDLPWIQMPVRPTPRVGTTIAFASRQLGLWAVHCCRVVYVVDESDAMVSRSGFAYGTLANHAVAGEERFVVDWDRQTDAVSFGITKFSEVRHPLVRLLGGTARRLQVQFSLQAIAALHRAVEVG